LIGGIVPQWEKKTSRPKTKTTTVGQSGK